MRKLITFVILVLCTCECAKAQSAQLISPVPRHSLLKAVNEVLHLPPEADLESSTWNCGGVERQWKINNGKCGICGDSWDGIRNFEKGGKFERGYLGDYYNSVSEIAVKASNPDKSTGIMEFRLCDAVEDSELQQSCYDKHVLTIKETKTTAYFVTSFETEVELTLVLPPGLTCDHCILQWTFVQDVKDCPSCFQRQTLRNCADIRISRHPNRVRRQVSSVRWQQHKNQHTIHRDRPQRKRHTIHHDPPHSKLSKRVEWLGIQAKKAMASPEPKRSKSTGAAEIYRSELKKVEALATKKRFHSNLSKPRQQTQQFNHYQPQSTPNRQQYNSLQQSHQAERQGKTTRHQIQPNNQHMFTPNNKQHQPKQSQSTNHLSRKFSHQKSKQQQQQQQIPQKYQYSLSNNNQQHYQRKFSDHRLTQRKPQAGRHVYPTPFYNPEPTTVVDAVANKFNAQIDKPFGALSSMQQRNSFHPRSSTHSLAIKDMVPQQNKQAQGSLSMQRNYQQSSQYRRPNMAYGNELPSPKTGHRLSNYQGSQISHQQHVYDPHDRKQTRAVYQPSNFKQLPKFDFVHVPEVQRQKIPTQKNSSPKTEVKSVIANQQQDKSAKPSYQSYTDPNGAVYKFSEKDSFRLNSSPFRMTIRKAKSFPVFGALTVYAARAAKPSIGNTRKQSFNVFTKSAPVTSTPAPTPAPTAAPQPNAVQVNAGPRQPQINVAQHQNVVKPNIGPQPPNIAQTNQSPKSPSASQPNYAPKPPSASQPNYAPNPPSAPQQNYAPNPPSAPKPNYAPNPPSVPQPNYAPNPPSAPQPNYAPNPPSAPQPNYAPNPPNAPQPNYAPNAPSAPQPNYAPNPPIASQPNYAPNPPSASQPNYAPQLPNHAQQNYVPQPPIAAKPNTGPQSPVAQSHPAQQQQPSNTAQQQANIGVPHQPQPASPKGVPSVAQQPANIGVPHQPQPASPKGLPSVAQQPANNQPQNTVNVPPVQVQNQSANLGPPSNTGSQPIGHTSPDKVNKEHLKPSGISSITKEIKGLHKPLYVMGSKGEVNKVLDKLEGHKATPSDKMLNIEEYETGFVGNKNPLYVVPSTMIDSKTLHQTSNIQPKGNVVDAANANFNPSATYQGPQSTISPPSVKTSAPVLPKVPTSRPVVIQPKAFNTPVQSVDYPKLPPTSAPAHHPKPGQTPASVIKPKPLATTAPKYLPQPIPTSGPVYKPQPAPTSVPVYQPQPLQPTAAPMYKPNPTSPPVIKQPQSPAHNQPYAATPGPQIPKVTKRIPLFLGSPDPIIPTLGTPKVKPPIKQHNVNNYMNKSPSIPVHNMNKSPSIPVHNVNKSPSIPVHNMNKSPSIPVHNVNKSPSIPVHNMNKSPSIPVHNMNKSPSIPVLNVNKSPSIPMHKNSPQPPKTPSSATGPNKHAYNIINKAPSANIPNAPKQIQKIQNVPKTRAESRIQNTKSETPTPNPASQPKQGYQPVPGSLAAFGEKYRNRGFRSGAISPPIATMSPITPRPIKVFNARRSFFSANRKKNLNSFSNPYVFHTGSVLRTQYRPKVKEPKPKKDTREKPKSMPLKSRSIPNSSAQYIPSSSLKNKKIPDKITTLDAVVWNLPFVTKNPGQNSQKTGSPQLMSNWQPPEQGLQYPQKNPKGGVQTNQPEAKTPPNTLLSNWNMPTTTKPISSPQKKNKKRRNRFNRYQSQTEKVDQSAWKNPSNPKMQQSSNNNKNVNPTVDKQNIIIPKKKSANAKAAGSMQAETISRPVSHSDQQKGNTATSGKDKKGPQKSSFSFGQMRSNFNNPYSINMQKHAPSKNTGQNQIEKYGYNTPVVKSEFVARSNQVHPIQDYARGTGQQYGGLVLSGLSASNGNFRPVTRKPTRNYESPKLSDLGNVLGHEQTGSQLGSYANSLSNNYNRIEPKVLWSVKTTPEASRIMFKDALVGASFNGEGVPLHGFYTSNNAVEKQEKTVIENLGPNENALNKYTPHDSQGKQKNDLNTHKEQPSGQNLDTTPAGSNQMLQKPSQEISHKDQKQNTPQYHLSQPQPMVSAQPTKAPQKPTPKPDFATSYPFQQISSASGNKPLHQTPQPEKGVKTDISNSQIVSPKTDKKPANPKSNSNKGTNKQSAGKTKRKKTPRRRIQRMYHISIPGDQSVYNQNMARHFQRSPVTEKKAQATPTPTEAPRSPFDEVLLNFLMKQMAADNLDPTKRKQTEQLIAALRKQNIYTPAPYELDKPKQATPTPAAYEHRKPKHMAKDHMNLASEPVANNNAHVASGTMKITHGQSLAQSIRKHLAGQHQGTDPAVQNHNALQPQETALSNNMKAHTLETSVQPAPKIRAVVDPPVKRQSLQPKHPETIAQSKQPEAVRQPVKSRRFSFRTGKKMFSFGPVKYKKTKTA